MPWSAARTQICVRCRKAPASGRVHHAGLRRSSNCARTWTSASSAATSTRIAKVESGEYEATVLALAGLRRLGLEERADHVFGFEEMLPSPAQGALAVECRTADAATRALLAKIDDPALRQTVTAERMFLATIDGGCSFPAAAYAEHFGSTLKLNALIAADGRIVRSKMAGQAETAGGLGK